MFIVSGIGFSLHFLSPLLLSEVQGLSPGWVGFVMVPAAIASALLGKAGGRLADGRGIRISSLWLSDYCWHALLCCLLSLVYRLF